MKLNIRDFAAGLALGAALVGGLTVAAGHGWGITPAMFAAFGMGWYIAVKQRKQNKKPESTPIQQ